MSTINAAWHEANRMPPRATLDDRVTWHLAHLKACGCRPALPGTVLAELKRRGTSLPSAKRTVPASAEPTAAELKGSLGSAHTLWSDILRVVEDAASPLAVVWKPSKSASGRMCLLQHKRRTLLYLTPDKGRITVAIVLGERACALAMASALPGRVKTMLADARKYPEGRGIRIPVRSRHDLPMIKKLVTIKVER